MKYIVEKITNLIVSNAPDKDGEMMIRIDSFENLQIYEAISRLVNEELAQKGLSVKIKLAKNKWKHFKNITDNTVCIQSMEQHGWVADEESITFYRNSQDTNVLILLGTEDEEDKGGLVNCYTISPEVLTSGLNGNYYDVFCNTIDFSQNDIYCVNKL